MLEEHGTTNDAKEKEKIITSLKALICGNPADRTVCCDVDYGEYRLDLIFFCVFNGLCNKLSIASSYTCLLYTSPSPRD